jgi:hypothetical protein
VEAYRADDDHKSLEDKVRGSFTCTSKKTTLSKKRPLRVRHMAGVLGLFVKSTDLGRSGERPNRLSKLQQKADRRQLVDLLRKEARIIFQQH